MQFLKYHALGNDYLVLRNELFGEQTPDWAVEPDPDAVIRICDRNRGLGSDGILVGKKMADTHLRDRFLIEYRRINQASLIRAEHHIFLNGNVTTWMLHDT